MLTIEDNSISFGVAFWVLSDEAEKTGKKVDMYKLAEIDYVCKQADLFAKNIGAYSTGIWVNTLYQLVIDIVIVGDVKEKCVKAKEISLISKYATCVADTKEPGKTTLSIIYGNPFVDE